MRNKREYHWQDGKMLRLGDNTVVMGILNGTPDSFSDGGKYLFPLQGILFSRDSLI